jgi:hypothetical protein
MAVRLSALRAGERLPPRRNTVMKRKGKKERKMEKKRRIKKRKTLFLVEFHSSSPIVYEYTINWGHFLTACHFVLQAI